MMNTSTTTANLDDIEVPHMLGDKHRDREAKISTPTPPKDDSRLQEESDDSFDFIEGDNEGGPSTSTHINYSRLLLRGVSIVFVLGTLAIVAVASSSNAATNTAASFVKELVAKATKAPKEPKADKVVYDVCPAGSDLTKGRLPNSVCDDGATFADCINCCEGKCKNYFCGASCPAGCDQFPVTDPQCYECEVCCGDFASQCVLDGQPCYVGVFSFNSPQLCSCCCSGNYDFDEKTFLPTCGPTTT